MYLAQLRISNFRKLQKVDLSFQPGLNVLVGSNNVGKTAVVEGLNIAGGDARDQPASPGRVPDHAFHQAWAGDGRDDGQASGAHGASVPSSGPSGAPRAA